MTTSSFGGLIGDGASKLRASPRLRPPRPRARRGVSPTQMIGVSPAPSAASALCAHQFVGFAMVGAALGMADNHHLRAGIGQHGGAEMSPVWAPLPAGWQSCPPSTIPAGRGDGQHRDSSVAGGQSATVQRGGSPAPADGQLFDLEQRGPQAVHLPVSGDQRRNVLSHLRPILALAREGICHNPSQPTTSPAWNARIC